MKSNEWKKIIGRFSKDNNDNFTEFYFQCPSTLQIIKYFRIDPGFQKYSNMLSDHLDNCEKCRKKFELLCEIEEKSTIDEITRLINLSDKMFIVNIYLKLIFPKN